ncbi:MAG: glycosyltransferase family 2 protein, partial [Acutalibacteraceae bacterium]
AEVIVTDDGSTDSTPKILAGYAEKYPDFIRIVTQKNAGPGSSINNGIANARGKYFRMVDGDDAVNPDEFRSFVDYLAKCDSDMVVCSYTAFDNDTNATEFHPSPSPICGQTLDFSKACAYLTEIPMHAVSYKTEIMREHVHTDNCFYTDMEYLMFPIPYVNTVSVTNHNVYQYRVSLSTQSMSFKSLRNHIDMHEKVLYRLIDLYEKNLSGFDAEKEDFFAKRINVMAGMNLAIYLSYEADEEHKKALYGFIKTLEQRSSGVYSRFAKLKTVRLLNLSKAFYRPLSNRVRSKNAE